MKISLKLNKKKGQLTSFLHTVEAIGIKKKSINKINFEKLYKSVT